jgi:hypothetical protein
MGFVYQPQCLMFDMNRRLSPKVREVLCAFVELHAEAQQAFNGAMNEYLLASPSRRRELIRAWSLGTGHLPVTDGEPDE